MRFDYRQTNPHSILGIHSINEHQKIIRLWRPGADQIFFELFGNLVEAKKTDGAGLFEYIVSSHITGRDYRVYHQNGLLAYDPYIFFPTFGEVDQYLFAKGVHYDLYHRMGGRLTLHEEVPGAKFTLWAPSAKSVSLVGDFNHWDGRVNPMRSLGHSGVWELFIPGLPENTKYKFEIETCEGCRILKADPYAVQSEFRPKTASILASLDIFEWNDHSWQQQKRLNANRPCPMCIYEVHLGSWKKQDGWRFSDYRTLAHELSDYCQEMGFNYVELLPIQEHPLDESWGYQVSGFYSVTSRFGTLDDFKYFVDVFHQRGIGVILDWVPGHFPTDDFSLGKFDGTALYEHADPKQGFHPHWRTHIFNYGRHEVSNFLIANALYWLESLHIDGLRVDAVASMLYLDYGREHGEWVPNCYGGIENLEAIEFIKHLNSIVHQRVQGALMIAEESTAFAGVSRPVEWGGLGFDFKWNMGWMNDTLRYFSKDPLFRKYHHDNLTFGLIYAFSERFVLVLSHDEVVHGKNALVSKMPGDIWQKFANLRLLLSYMMCQVGKKLLFMGGEIGQWSEWNASKEIDWALLHYSTHKGVQRMVKELNHLYLTSTALWEKDFEHDSFAWVDFADTHNCVISYIRRSQHEQLLCIHNFTPNTHPYYQLPLWGYSKVEEVFNSDHESYGGSGRVNPSIHISFDGAGKSQYIGFGVAPLATMIFRVEN